MPPKGGNPALSEDDLLDIVRFNAATKERQGSDGEVTFQCSTTGARPEASLFWRFDHEQDSFKEFKTTHLPHVAGDADRGDHALVLHTRCHCTGRPRRRSEKQEAKPIELTAEQVSQLTKVANDRKLNFDDLVSGAKSSCPAGSIGVLAPETKSSKVQLAIVATFVNYDTYSRVSSIAWLPTSHLRRHAFLPVRASGVKNET